MAKDVNPSKRINWVQVMRTSALLFTGVLFAVNLLLAAPGHGQGKLDKIISLDYRNSAFLTVIKAVEKKAEVVIMYELTPSIENEKVDIIINNATVTEVLNFLIKDKKLKWSYKESENIIRLEDASDPATSRGLKLWLFTHDFNRQNNPPISGIIRGPDGQPISGVNIVVKGTSRGTTSAANGSFSIDANMGDRLVISSIGYAAREIMLSNTENILVSLAVSTSPLDEVQVIAYGTTTQRLSTGVVSTVKAKDIEKQPVNNPLLALQGRVPGLVVTQSTGLPGSGISVRIQGQNTISGGVGNDPLYVIDGVPYTSRLLYTL